MTDIYMNGAEVHAETPEEEREASLILNAALSGKTTPADGCICPDQRDSTVGKGFSMRFCDGTDMTVTPTLDVEGNPEMEICCNMGDVVEETAEEPTYYYEVTLEPKPVLRSYIAAAYDLLGPSALPTTVRFCSCPPHQPEGPPAPSPAHLRP